MSIEYTVAQLRHAYKQLAAGTVVDQKQFADGLIAPQIKFLEEIIAATEKQQEAYDRFVYLCKNPKPPTQALIDLMRKYRKAIGK